MTDEQQHALTAPAAAVAGFAAEAAEVRLAYEVAAFIRQQADVGIDELLIQIDARWPNLRVRTLVVAHFINVYRLVRQWH
jgi:hypothetical protein